MSTALARKKKKGLLHVRKSSEGAIKMMEDLTLEKRLKEEKCPGGPPTSVLGNLGMWRNYSLEWEATGNK